MCFKKVILMVSFLVVFGLAFVFNTHTVQAQTVAELQALIAQLQSQIAQLQQQLAQIQKPAVWCYDFNVTLKYGDRGEEVKALQTALKKEGLLSDKEIAAESNYFGESTAAAVVDFQLKNKDEISKYAGYSIRASGVFGKGTRTKMNELYGCEKRKGKPFIEIISPNGGERWVIGNTYDIKWKSSGVEKVFINLLDHTAPETCLLNKGEPISAELGKFTFKLDTCLLQPGMGYQKEVQISPGDKYKIHIHSQKEYERGAPITDESDNYFSIVEAIETGAPFIQVLSPNGGEMWIIGEKHLIKLSDRPVKCLEGAADCTVYSIQLVDENRNYVGTISCGYFTPREAISQLKTEIEWNTQTVLTSCGAGSSSQEFKPGKYKIRIADRYSSEIVDESDNYFTIAPATAPFIQVLSPNGGERWVVGNTYTVRWDSRGVNQVRIYIVNPSISGSGSTNYIVPDNQSVSASAGYYNWIVGQVGLPAGVGGGAVYKIRINDVDSNLFDYSDNYFSIVAATTTAATTTAATFDLIKSQLASVSEVVSQIAERVKELMGR